MGFNTFKKNQRPKWLSRHDDGRHFQIYDSMSRPGPKHFASAGSKTPSSPIPLSALEEHADLHEAKLLLKATKLEKRGFKPWTISVAYLDGTVEDVDVIARGWEHALRQARKKLHGINSRKVDKIIIEDPDFGAFFKKVGAGARQALGGLKRGVTKGISLARKAKAQVMPIARRVKTEAESAAHLAGRIAATPGEIHEAYHAGLEGPTVEPPYHKPSAGEITSRQRANIAKDRLVQAKAEEELQKIEERRRLQHRGGWQ